MSEKYRIKILKNGPYLILGRVPMYKEAIITDGHGTPIRWEKTATYPIQETYTLCRCGKSQNKPICDGTHSSVKFDGVETASRNKFSDQADKNYRTRPDSAR